MNHLKIIPLEERIVFDGAAAAHILYVNASAHSGGNGLSWGSAFNDLQTAINTADHLTGSTQIWVAKGTYTPDAVPGNPSSATFLINDPNPLAIYGGFNVGANNLSQCNSTGNTTILNGVLSGGGNVDTIVTINGGTVTLEGLTISGANNSSGSGGGVLQTSGTLTVSNDTFTNNIGDMASGDVGGGGIASFNSNLMIANSIFNDNTASVGAAVFASGDATLTITSSSFLKNNMTDGYDGGALFAENGQNINISLSTFNNNVSAPGGVAGIELLFYNNVTMDSNTINNNTALNTNPVSGSVAGLALFFDNNVTMDSNTITHNNAAGSVGFASVGGLVVEVGDNVTLQSNIIDNNVGSPSPITLSNVGIGGLLVGFFNNVTIQSNIIDNNTGGYGGLETALNTNVSVTHNNISGNVGLGFGSSGGYATTIDTNPIISGNIFSNNTAVDTVGQVSSGGGLAVYGETGAIITNNTFINNVADYGGAIWSANNPSITITHNLFQDNSANFAGGAITSGAVNSISGSDGNINISQNVFLGNKAGTYGGALASQDDTTITLNQNVFSFNTAANGGAISDTSSYALSITSDFFLGNSATTQGNSLWLDGGQTTVNGLPLTPQSALITALVNANYLLFSDDIAI